MTDGTQKENMPDKSIINTEAGISPATDSELNANTENAASTSTKAGRPEKIITDAVSLKIIHDCAMLGYTDAQIADELCIASGTFSEKKKLYPEINEAVLRGKSDGLKLHASTIAKESQKGSLRAAELFLRCKGGWGETNTINIETVKPLIIELTPPGGNGNGHDEPTE